MKILHKTCYYSIMTTVAKCYCLPIFALMKAELVNKYVTCVNNTIVKIQTRLNIILFFLISCSLDQLVHFQINLTSIFFCIRSGHLGPRPTTLSRQVCKITDYQISKCFCGEVTEKTGYKEFPSTFHTMYIVIILRHACKLCHITIYVNCYRLVLGRFRTRVPQLLRYS